MYGHQLMYVKQPLLLIFGNSSSKSVEGLY